MRVLNLLLLLTLLLVSSDAHAGFWRGDDRDDFQIEFRVRNFLAERSHLRDILTTYVAHHGNIEREWQTSSFTDHNYEYAWLPSWDGHYGYDHTKPVPEPDSVVLFLVGLGLVGFAVHRLAPQPTED